MRKKKIKLKKKFRNLLNLIKFIITLVLIIYFLTLFLKKEETKKEPTLILNTERVYLSIGESYSITSNLSNTKYETSSDIVNVNGSVLTGLSVGTANLTATSNNLTKSVEVIVTDLYTIPVINNKKEKLTCNEYTKEEETILDEALALKIKTVGLKTRSGVVAAARFLSLEFPYRIPYFYENGRLVNYGDQDYADGEGRYYHKGLYLTENKFSKIKSSVHGPAAWGCPLLTDTLKIKAPNGLDCSGFVSWALLNGGYDVGDVGAGINEDRNDDLDDLSTKMKLTEENFDASLVKPGDLIGRYGHIGIIIGKEDSTFYIAESLDYDLHVLTMTRDEIIESDWLYIELMDDYYKKDGNLKEMW